jgi:hypothetical protein
MSNSMGDPAMTDIYHKCIVKRFDRPYSQPITVIRTETFANMECYEWLSNLAKSMVGPTESVQKILITIENGQEVFAQGTNSMDAILHYKPQQIVVYAAPKSSRIPLSKRPSQLCPKQH